MTHHSRRILAVQILTWACVSTLPVAAHNGSHGPSMMARVERATVLGHQVNLRLMLTGLGPPLVLEGMAVPDAMVRFQGPLTFSFAQDVGLIAAVTFDETPPRIFTLMLDFGAAGAGGVTVIPERVGQ
ncbi:hypothetical protein [Tateyamaria omphalii]|uniref:Uncharacterized protein n=1 Tax=Tateyamaria omphalii TaxID=299262 RepID=A0A1P8MV18_9RHOB|nr:hypothetical protein [Tateyamaria omphalii]APX11861.1 hypothetical protein BWR18_09340 [Tateyamaria omphalii]